MGWETLQTQRANSKAITMFNVLNDLAPSPLTELFVPKNNVTDYNLRGSSTSLQLSIPRTEKLKKSFSYDGNNIDKKTSRRFDLRAFVRRVSYDGAKLWHSLPLDLRDLNNLVLFKKGISAFNF